MRMKQTLASLAGCAALVLGVHGVQAENLLSNPGWDEAVGQADLVGTATVVVNESALPGWQCVIVDTDAGGGTASFTSAADAAAISAPNALTIKRGVLGDDTKNVDDCQIRKDSGPSTLTEGHVYRNSLYARDLDGNYHSLLQQTSLFSAEGAYLQGKGGMTAQLTGQWEKIENSFAATSSAGTVARGSLGIIPLSNGFEAQIDSACLEDITAEDRMINGGFENSSSRLLNWNPIDAGTGFTAELVTDAAEGNNALRIYNTVASGDGLLSKDGGYHLPWDGSNAVYLSFQLKDDPTLSSGEHIVVQVCEFDENDAFLGPTQWGAPRLATAQWTTYVEMFSNLNPDTKFLTVNFRIVNAATGVVTGDVLLDDIHVYDLTAGGRPTQQANLIYNGGWDFQTGDVTLSEAFNSGETFTGWQVYAIGGTPAGSTQYTAVADPDAISAPNIFVFNKLSATGDSAARRDSAMAGIIGGNIFRHGVWIRDEVSTHGVSIGTSLFDSTTAFLGSAGGTSHAASDQWELVENTFMADADAAKASFGMRLTNTTGSLQLDSAFLVDATNFDRMTNGGFENSGRAVLNWGVTDVGGCNFTAQIVADASQGNRAVRIAQDNVGEGTDGVLNKDGSHALPWHGDNIMQIFFSVKDDPALATGEYVNVRVCGFDADKNFLNCALNKTRLAGDGEYAEYDEVVRDLDPATAYVSVSFRITDQGGVEIDGDLLLDDVQVYDTVDVDPDPPTAARGAWTLY